MPIALTGSPPYVPTSGPRSYAALITGNDSEFTSTTGAWAATGGTMSRDTGAYKVSGLAASLKHVTTAAGHRVDLPLSGTFLAGASYAVMVWLALEEAPAAASMRVQFGLVGTDVADTGVMAFVPSTRQYIWSNNSGLYWGVVIMRWVPSANRTGVTLRVERPSADSSNTQTWHVGTAKAYRLPNADAPPTFRGVGSLIDNVLVGPSTLDFSGGGANIISGSTNIYLRLDGASGWDLSDPWTGIQAGDTYGMYFFAEAPKGSGPGDLTTEGYEFQVGPDYIGMYISEKDNDTVQLYADSSGGYMMQLRNRGSGKGWAISDDGTVNQKITDTFQWEFYVAGAQTTGTDKAAYFQAPGKCKIDEVRIHLGTAPTGTNFIVDVNDDGTTIFTSQGNRPEIAVSTNDDTSGAPDGGTAVAKDSVITVDVDQIGSGTAGSDLVVFVRGRYIW